MAKLRSKKPKIEIEKEDEVLTQPYTGIIEKEILDVIKKQAKIEERPFSYIINRLMKNYYNELMEQKTNKDK